LSDKYSGWVDKVRTSRYVWRVSNLLEVLMVARPGRNTPRWTVLRFSRKLGEGAGQDVPGNR